LGRTERNFVSSERNPQSPNSRPPKLEKADVLELTVAYVKKMKARTAFADDCVDGFEAGFKRCLNEVCKFLENEDNKMKSRLVSYLNNSSDSYLSRLALLINSNEDTSSSCSNSSRSQTPASVSTEPCQMEYSSNSPFTDNEQEVPSNERSLSSRTFQSHHVTPSGTIQRDIGHQCCSNCGGPSMSKIKDPTTAPLNLATNSNTRETGQFENESPEYAGGNVCCSVSHGVWRPWHEKL
ncbi:transcription factor HES-4, partial [Trichonephila clavata]